MTSKQCSPKKSKIQMGVGVSSSYERKNLDCNSNRPSDKNSAVTAFTSRSDAVIVKL